MLSLRKKKIKFDIYQNKDIDFTNEPSMWRSFHRLWWYTTSDKQI